MRHRRSASPCLRFEIDGESKYLSADLHKPLPSHHNPPRRRPPGLPRNSVYWIQQQRTPETNSPMQNYFNYFTEIEQRFQQRRGSLLMLSTLDWALIETWREAGIPLEAVLRGIDNAFDKHDAKALRSPGRMRKVNGLAWCAQSVMEAVEQLMEASIGAAPAAGAEAMESGFEAERISR